VRIETRMEERATQKGSIIEKFVPILLLITIALAFLVGALWQKVASLEKGNPTAGTNTAGQPADAGTVNGKLSEDQAKKVPEVTDKDHIQGSKDAKVLLVEYSDLQCPYCQAFHLTAQQAFDEYKGDIAWVYRHFPLDTIHPRARPAANAAECVSDLGGDNAFWKFIDEVFANQSTALSDSGLAAAAVKSGASSSSFDSCYKATKFDSVVESDYQGGSTAGVTGTPGNFIMNKKGEVWVIPGAVPLDQLKQAIDEALK